LVAHGRSEKCKGAVAAGAPINDIRDSLALLLRAAIADVDAVRATPLVNRAWPRGRIDEIHAVQLRITETALADVITHQRLATTEVWQAIEIARAAEITVATLHIVAF